MHPFDDAIALDPKGDGRWEGRTTAPYRNMVGPFGGVVAALFVNAVMQDPRFMGQPVSQTVNFCGGIEDGAMEITTKLARSGKYLQHWTVALLQNGDIRATGTLVTGERGDVFSHQTQTAPVAPPAQDVERTATDLFPLPFLGQYNFRFLTGGFGDGGTPEAPASADSLMWISDAEPRPLDFLSLAAMADSFYLRLIKVRGGLGRMGTVSLTTHFLATPDELFAQKDAPILAHADAHRFHGQIHDQQSSLWSTDGKVLATGNQIAWYKE